MYFDIYVVFARRDLHGEPLPGLERQRLLPDVCHLLPICHRDPRRSKHLRGSEGEEHLQTSQNHSDATELLSYSCFLHMEHKCMNE